MPIDLAEERKAREKLERELEDIRQTSSKKHKEIKPLILEYLKNNQDMAFNRKEIYTVISKLKNISFKLDEVTTGGALAELERENSNVIPERAIDGYWYYRYINLNPSQPVKKGGWSIIFWLIILIAILCFILVINL